MKITAAVFLPVDQSMEYADMKAHRTTWGAATDLLSLPARAIGILVLITSPAYGAIIGVGQFSQSGGGESLPFDSVSIAFGSLDPTTGGISTTNIFKNIFITTSNIGQTFISDNSNEPNFNAIVNILTNGIDDFVGTEVFIPNTGPGVRAFGSFSQESDFFSKGPGLSGVDFKGSIIDSIGMHIDNLSITLVSGIANVEDNGEIIIYGVTVPEPSTLMLFGLGTLSVIVYAWRGRIS